MANTNLMYALFSKDYTHATKVEQDGVPCRTISEGCLYPVVSDGVHISVFYDDMGQKRSIWEFGNGVEFIDPEQVTFSRRE
jgi:hypothetical protein